MKETKITEWFLRISLSAGFLSAVADRFGMWPKAISVWGDWQNFAAYTKSLNPYAPDGLVSFMAYTATGLEIVLGILLLTHFKTTLVAKVSCALLLLFALSMTFSNSIKAAFDYSVFTAAAAALALATILSATQKESKK